jgi:hypothetical protein
VTLVRALPRAHALLRLQRLQQRFLPRDDQGKLWKSACRAAKKVNLLKLKKNRASAAVQKDAGDDPDSVGIVKSVLRHLFADT